MEQLNEIEKIKNNIKSLDHETAANYLLFLISCKDDIANSFASILRIKDADTRNLKNQLESYRKTGFEPCDFKLMESYKSDADEARVECSEAIKELARVCTQLKVANKRLEELEDKIEQGILIELPCKIGDTVYVLVGMNQDGRYTRIKPDVIECIYQNPDGGWMISFERVWHDTELSDIGETVFLTLREAEASERRG